MNGHSKISAERLKLLNRTPEKIVHLPVIVGFYRGEDGFRLDFHPAVGQRKSMGRKRFALLSMRRHAL